jgi:hypothetical protein
VTGTCPLSLVNEPDDAAILELGRLTWAAIKLEDVVYHMGDALGLDSAQMMRAPVSQCVNDTLKVLDSWPESEIRDNARTWFNAARDALNDRNSVLHVIPGVWVTIADDHSVTPRGPVIEYLGRRGGYRRHSMTAEGLRPVRRRLEEARAGWAEIFLALAEEHKRISHDNT